MPNNHFQRDQQVKALAREHQYQERLEKEYWDELKPPPPSANQYLQKAIELEDAGRLEEATTMYEHALAQEQDNLVLRRYIGELYNRMNARRVGYSLTNTMAVRNSREQILQRAVMPKQHIRAMHRSPLLGDPTPNPSGSVKNAKLYREELQAQQRRERERKERIARYEKEWEAANTSERQRQEALAKYNNQVVAENDKLRDARLMRELKKKEADLKRQLAELDTSAERPHTALHSRAGGGGRRAEGPGPARAAHRGANKAGHWSPSPVRGAKGRQKDPRRPASAGPSLIGYPHNTPHVDDVLDPARYEYILHDADRKYQPSPRQRHHQHSPQWQAHGRPSTAHSPPPSPSPGRINMQAVREHQQKFYDKHQRPDKEAGVPAHRREKFVHPMVQRYMDEYQMNPGENLGNGGGGRMPGPRGTQHMVLEAWPNPQQWR